MEKHLDAAPQGKLEKCGQCQSFQEYKCQLGYAVNANSKPCRQGTLRSRPRP